MSANIPDSEAADIETEGSVLGEVARRVDKLLNALGVACIISVDDQNVPLPAQQLPEIRDAIRGNDDARRQICVLLAQSGIEISQIDPENSQDVIDLLDREWNGLGDEFHISALQTVDAKNAIEAENLDGAEARAELSGPTILIEAVGKSARVIRMNRARWMAEHEELLSVGSEKTLVFFDRDFSREEGGTEESGDQLLRDLIDKNYNHVTGCLLTKYAEDEDDELRHTQRLLESLETGPSSLVVIGKFRLENSAKSFPEALRLLLLADEIELLRELTFGAIDAAAAEARQAIRDLQRYAVVATVASGHEEGAFETDGLTRLTMSTFRRRILEAHRDPSFASSTLPALRDISAINVYQESLGTGAQLAELLWNDQFESSEFLSRLALPIEIGDIFEVKALPESGAPSAKARKYILLTQACDLSVRTNGKRSDFVREFVLHEFRAMARTDEGHLRDTYGRMQKVGAFVKGSDHIWGVDFASRITVPDLAVDATVGTPDGKSYVSADESLEAVMSAGWVTRRSIIKKEVATMVATVSKFESDLPESTANQSKKQAMERLGASIARGSVIGKSGVSAVVDTSKKSVEYGIRRIGRVVGPTAVGLVSMSAQHLGRPAFEGELV